MDPFVWVAGALAAGVWIAHATAKHLDQKRKALIALQFWDADLADAPGLRYVRYVEVHFPSMLMRQRLILDDGTSDVRLFHVRRISDGTWEAQITDGSYASRLAELEHRWNVRGWRIDDEIAEFRSTERKWERVVNPKLAGIETAYQKYIHTPEIPVIRADEAWKEEEADQAKEQLEQRKRELAERQNARRETAKP